MKRIYDFSRNPAVRNYTIHDLRALKGSGQKLSMTNPAGDDETRACVEAGIDLFVVGADQIEEVIFGFVKETELQQELVDIVEHGNYITCFLKITTKTGESMNVVEVFLVDEEGKVKNIWAL